LVGYWVDKESLERAASLIETGAQNLDPLDKAAIVASLRKLAPNISQRITVETWDENLQRTIAEIPEILSRIQTVEANPKLRDLAEKHPTIAESVLAETAKLHAGDAENRRLWAEFLPCCEDEIDRMYKRLGVTFDHTLGESFYEDRLAAVVEELLGRRIARESDGAIAIFLDGIETPMLVRKKDGAFLYGTTDLATIRYPHGNLAP